MGNNKTLEKQYVEELERVLEHGYDIEDRTGTGCKFLSGVQFKYDRKNDNTGPVLLGRRIVPSLGYKEMLWFLMGKNDKESLNALGVHYWDKFFKEDGTIGKSYGYQMRNSCGKDQLKGFLEGIKNEPFSRRHILSLWNTGDLEVMALPPCFYNYQVCVKRNDKGGTSFDLIVTSRSGDGLLGVPYNFITSTFLAMIIDSYCFGGMFCSLDSIVWNIGHFHIYNNHFNQVRKYIKNYNNLEREGFLDNVDNKSLIVSLYSLINEYINSYKTKDLDDCLKEIYEGFISGDIRKTLTEKGKKVVFDGYSHLSNNLIVLPDKIDAPLSV